MDSGKKAAVQMRDITKSFGSVKANDRVWLDIYKGEILALLGENGSGKTTLMNMLSGIYYPDEGQVFVDGREVVIRSPKDAFDLGIGMIHQHFKLVDVLTAAENIILGLPGKGKLDMKSVAAKVREISEKYGFEVDPNQKIYDMSVSQKQTVEIVKVLYRGADILILDEPTAVLTPQETDKLFAVLRNMRDDGKAIVIITHKLHEVEDLSDRVAILRHGHFVGDMPTKKTNAGEMTNMMVGRPVVLNIERPEPVNPEPRLEVSHLTVHDEEGVKKLDDVSFTAYAGEILGIAGISGSGQKELLEAIAGLHRAEGGSITYIEPGTGAREELVGKDPRDISDMGVALSFVPEDRLGMGLVGDMDLADNMMLRSFRRGRGFFTDRKSPHKLAERVVEELEVNTPSIETPVRTPLRRQRAEGARRPRDIQRAHRPAHGLRRARPGHQLVLHDIRPHKQAEGARRRRRLRRRGFGRAARALRPHTRPLRRQGQRAHTRPGRDQAPRRPHDDKAGRWQRG